MFEIASILEFAKSDGTAQTLLLAAIWWQSKGLRRDMNKKFQNHDDRIIILEKHAGLKPVTTGD